MHICLIKETKSPPDARVAFSPHQVAKLKVKYPQHTFSIEPSSIRCFKNTEYKNLGIDIIEHTDEADILIGIKEVQPHYLIPNKTYLFFSHTSKKQAHNQKLLQKASHHNITLIDYEHVTYKGERIAAFGYWAGIVGTYNALRGYGKLQKSFELVPAHHCADIQFMKAELKKVKFSSPVQILVTGEGRVALGACEILDDAGIRMINPENYPPVSSNNSIYCQIGPQYYCVHKKGRDFNFSHFTDKPEEYESNFDRYGTCTDMLIAAHYWDPESPKLFNLEQVHDPKFRIKLIADITCDINGSVPTTLRASDMDNPYYGVNKTTLKECDPFSENSIAVMAVDNLPGAMPREASVYFGKKLTKVMDELLGKADSQIIQAATILKQGKLTKHFNYLQNFLNNL